MPTPIFGMPDPPATPGGRIKDGDDYLRALAAWMEQHLITYDQGPLTQRPLIDGTHPGTGRRIFRDTNTNTLDLDIVSGWARIYSPTTRVTVLPSNPYDDQIVDYRPFPNASDFATAALVWTVKWRADFGVWIPVGAQNGVRVDPGGTHSVNGGNGSPSQGVAGNPEIKVVVPTQGTYRVQFGALGVHFTGNSGGALVDAFIDLYQGQPKQPGGFFNNRRAAFGTFSPNIGVPVAAQTELGVSAYDIVQVLVGTDAPSGVTFSFDSRYLILTPLFLNAVSA